MFLRRKRNVSPFLETLQRYSSFRPILCMFLFSLICIDVDIMVVDQDMAEKAGKKQKLANDGRQARREDLIMKVASLLGPHFTKLK